RSEMSTATIRAPSVTKRRTADRPMPPPAPVKTTTLPSRRPGEVFMMCSLVSCGGSEIDAGPSDGPLGALLRREDRDGQLLTVGHIHALTGLLPRGLHDTDLATGRTRGLEDVGEAIESVPVGDLDPQRVIAPQGLPRLRGVDECGLRAVEDLQCR